jgi:hypothetical protein
MLAQGVDLVRAQGGAAVKRAIETSSARNSIDALKLVGPIGHGDINFRGTFRFLVDRNAERIVLRVA